MRSPRWKNILRAGLPFQVSRLSFFGFQQTKHMYYSPLSRFFWCFFFFPPTGLPPQWKEGETQSSIYRGVKIISPNIREKQLKVIDSYNFIGMALSKFSPTFNLSCHNEYFPHKQNTLDNQGKITDFPEASDFNPDSMSAPRSSQVLWVVWKRKG